MPAVLFQAATGNGHDNTLTYVVEMSAARNQRGTDRFDISIRTSEASE